MGYLEVERVLLMKMMLLMVLMAHPWYFDRGQAE
jgi:hypothetical protein